MAKLVPEQVVMVPGLTSYFAEVTARAPIKHFQKAWENGSSIRIWGVECLITQYEAEASLDSGMQFRVTIVPKRTVTPRRWARIVATLTRRYGSVRAWMERDVHTFKNPAHVKHEWRLSELIAVSEDQTFYVITQDNVRPEWPHEEYFETLLQEIERVWDSDLCDEIDEVRVLARRVYTTKDEAREGHREWVRKYRQMYRKEGTIKAEPDNKELVESAEV